MKKILVFLLLISNFIFSQKEKSSKMEQTTLDELKMSVYEKDSTASAVVLYEHANLYLDPKNNHETRIDYYYRIKIFNKNSLDLANISINLFKKKRIKDIKAITYNLNKEGFINKTPLLKKDIFTLNLEKDWTTTKIALPNVKVGSIIEYKYSVLSPYLSIPDWYFQSNTPKVKSEFKAAILGNYQYNARLIGYLKLEKDKPSIKENCVNIPGIGKGTCAVYSYGMFDIPAFKEEDHMLSKKNYISRLSFDLKSYTDIRGNVKKHTTTWEKADKSLKKYFFNNQTSKKSFFKSKIPNSIFNIESEIEKAKKIFSFIKNHFTWNDENWTNKDVKLREAYKNKTGSVGEINLSLYNSLKVAEIDVDLVVLSTRNNGIPTRLYPIIFDYNYVVSKANINGKNYYLDATDKFLHFGQLPLRTLNGEARIINMKEEGNWTILKPNFSSRKNIRAELTLNNEAEFIGNLSINRSGYFALNQRKIIFDKNENDYLEVFESQNPNIEVENYSNVNLDSLEKSFTETFSLKISLDTDLSEKTRINPFFFLNLKENPFKLKERKYPVNFGYLRAKTYSIKINIPDNYKITQQPKDLAISLPNNGGHYILKTMVKGNSVNIIIRSSISKKEYSANEYHYLKEFYNQIIQAENSYLILEKK